jgi:hypothetical protein
MRKMMRKKNKSPNHSLIDDETNENISSYSELDMFMETCPETKNILLPLINRNEHLSKTMNSENFEHLTQEHFDILDSNIRNYTKSKKGMFDIFDITKRLESLIWTKLYIFSRNKQYKFIQIKTIWLDTIPSFKVNEEFLFSLYYKDIIDLFKHNEIIYNSFDDQYHYHLYLLLSELIYDKGDNKDKIYNDILSQYRRYGDRFLYEFIQKSKYISELGYNIIDYLLFIANRTGNGDLYHSLYEDFGWSIQDESLISENPLLYSYNKSKNNGLTLKDLFAKVLNNRYLFQIIMEYYLNFYEDDVENNDLMIVK